MITVYGQSDCSQCRAIANGVMDSYPEDCEWVEVGDDWEIPQLAVNGQIVAVGYQDCYFWIINKYRTQI